MHETPSVTLAVIGDIHSHAERLERVLARIASARADGILLVGDLGSGGLHLARFRSRSRIASYERSVKVVLERVQALGLPVLWVPGNHDLPDLEGPGNIDGRSAELAGLRIAGVGGSGPARFGFAYEWGEDEIRALAVPACDVLLCHAPPLGTPLDVLARDRRHVGSQALRELAERHDGVYVCGHIHESPGSIQLGRCLCLNVGGLGEPFGRAQVGFVRSAPELPERFEVRHEDLESGAVRTWARQPAE
jgi:Icc-related predicted phosphoesterase